MSTKTIHYISIFISLLLPLVIKAEPSGRGVDIDVSTSLGTDLSMLIFGVFCLVIGGISYLFRQYKFLEVLFYILLILGGLTCFIGCWSLLSKFVLFPIFYTIGYIIKVVLYVAIMLLPFIIGYLISAKITNNFLKVCFFIVIAIAILIGEYYCIAQLGAGEWFPKWDFMNEFYSILYPVED